MPDSLEWILSKCESELESFPEPAPEINQHLVELGYAPAHALSFPEGRLMQKARDEFEADLGNSDLFPVEELRMMRRMGKNRFLQHYLRRLTDIDEGIVLPGLPSRGEINLATRLVHYRLDLMGLWEMPVNSSFGTSSVVGLERLADFGKCTPFEAINQLADIEQFTVRLLASYPEESFIVTFQSVRSSDDSRSKLAHRNSFGRQLKQDFGERTDFLKFLQQNIFNRREETIDYSYLARVSKSDFNRFLVRLIQVHQWQEGFYNGLLDSDLGDLSLKSFVDAIKAYNLADEKDVKIKRFLTYLGQDYFMFNALFFLKEYMVEHEPAGQEDVWTQLATQVGKADDDSQSVFSQRLDQLQREISHNKQPEERRGLLARIYYGVKKLLKKALRFVRKIYRWVIDKVAQMWSFLKKLFADFFENLAQGLSMFVNGVRFLLGRKIIATSSGRESLISKFQLDGDVSSIAFQASSETVRLHLDETRNTLGEMNFSLTVVGMILKTIMQSLSLISWPFLLFTIVKGFRQVSANFKYYKTY
ncbi:hypothetical protein [Mangrovibacterium lignilyticum]|uniref:hypothetical protein n=1 Tax=Mangrovibacterium lignilyticum TaxID=2668052 RepID=UPI0019684BDA|nr:hypothetical protein [Mangrovibacterium lignilyticum]